MSATDTLTQLRKRTVERIEALSPMVKEHATLTQSLAVLDGQSKAANSSQEHQVSEAPSAAAAESKTPSTRAVRQRARPAARRPGGKTHIEAVIEALRAAGEPRVVKDIAKTTHLDRRAVQNTLGHLRRRGQVQRTDNGWMPMTAGTVDDSTAEAKPESEHEPVASAVDEASAPQYGSIH